MTVATRWLRAGGRRVPLLAGPAALEALPGALSEAGFAGSLFVVADERAMALHGARVRSVVPEAPLLCISGDEANKTLDQVAAIWDWLVARRAQRRDALVAFGGGVVCDLVGFAAASYLRGIGLVNVPTTLLAQVDAAVGGKTGINHAQGKNLIGAFYQPLCVVADTALLASLPPRAFGNGMAEVAKIAMILDADLFGRLELEIEHLSAAADAALAPIVARSIELKADIVERDERESGERMLLNYGHTVGHALEAASGYGTLLHGEAVAIGMRAAALIAREMDILDEVSAQRQADLLTRLHLPAHCTDVAPDEVLQRLVLDKKRAGSVQRWILAERVGMARIVTDVPVDTVQRAVQAVTGYAA
jgi:3-dehydroquinate synthase